MCNDINGHNIWGIPRGHVRDFPGSPPQACSVFCCILTILYMCYNIFILWLKHSAGLKSCFLRLLLVTISWKAGPLRIAISEPMSLIPLTGTPSIHMLQQLV